METGVCTLNPSSMEVQITAPDVPSQAVFRGRTIPAADYPPEPAVHRRCPVSLSGIASGIGLIASTHLTCHYF